MKKKRSTRKASQKPFDAGAFVESLPEEEIDLDAIQAETAPARFKAKVEHNPAYAIDEFLGNFAFRKDKATLAVQPEPYLLEYLAEQLNQYWGGRCGTVDEALGLKGKGKGAKTPKERYIEWERQFAERFVYEAYLKQYQIARRTQKLDDSPSELAVKATAKHFNATKDQMKKRLLRK